MEISTIIKNAMKYPLEDKKTWLITSIVSLILPIALTIIEITDIDSLYSVIRSYDAIILIILIVLAIFVILIYNGLIFEAMSNAIKGKLKTENLSVKNIIKHGAYNYVIQIVYGVIIGLLYVLSLAMSMILFRSYNIVHILLAYIGTVLFSFVLNVAIIHYADTDNISDALNIGKVGKILEEIGLINYIIFNIVIGIIVTILSFILLLICMIPHIGVYIALSVGVAYILLFSSYALGLMYKDEYKIKNQIEI